MNEEKRQCGVCILVMCGLPGAGKSSVLHLLKQRNGTDDTALCSEYTQTGNQKFSNQNPIGHASSVFPSSVDSKCVTTEDCIKEDLIHCASKTSELSNESVKGRGTSNLSILQVSYDDILTEEVEQQLIQNSLGDGQEVSDWKSYRDKIVLCVDYLLQPRTEKSQHPVLEENMLDQALWDRVCCRGNAKDIIKDKENAVIVIDDNMYYRSMRYKYYQLARKYEIGFCEVYVECDTQIAIERNERRSQRKVPENVIVTMATKMEKPDPLINPWEKYSLAVDGTQLKNCIPDVIQLIQSAIQNPVQPTVEQDLEAKEVSRQICSTNQIHQADQIMRKLITQVMMQAKDKQLPKSALQSKAKLLGSKRTEVLENLRNGNILLPDFHKSQQATLEEDTNFHGFISDLFLKLLKDGDT